VSYVIILDVAGTVSFRDSAATILAEFPLLANTGVSFGGNIEGFAVQTGPGEGLVINNPAGVNTLGHLVFVVV